MLLNLIKQKISIFIVGFTLFLLLVHTLYYTPKIASLTNQIYSQKSQNIKDEFKNLVANKHGRTAMLTYLISQDKKIIDALLKNDRTLLNYKEIIRQLELYGEDKNLWIQVIDKDGYSFYRSWTENVGDHAASARLDIAQMIKSPQAMQGVSTGRFDMTFKTMLPLYSEGEFIGMVEMISKFNSIAAQLKKQNIEPLFLLHESYKEQFIKPFTGLFIDNHYVANLNAKDELLKSVQKEGVDKFLHIDDFMIFEDYLVCVDEIKDIHGGEMGFFIFFFKKELLDHSFVSEFKAEYLTKMILFLILFILSALYFLNREYIKKLNKEVALQTSKIKQQQEDLQALLTIYDKNVIFSKTDLKGYITHASEAFCKISGYSKEELLGQNHNIVRHSDMPKELFRELWSELKDRKRVSVEIKNRKKDGEHYWIDAEIEPDYDKDGALIGYSAIRQDITANKEIEEIQKEIIFTMGSIGECRSKETANHVNRVAEYSKLLALEFGMDEEEVEMLWQASPMHDIGKVAIPDNILHKPHKLTENEFEIIKTHTIKGYEMLKLSTRPLLKTAAIVALSHHEKWDGSGYPRGLSGEEIHIYGRITAIADVFDALGSNRCYKDAWELERILEFIKSQKEKHFDPALVDIFFKNLDKFIKIKERLRDENLMPRS